MGNAECLLIDAGISQTQVVEPLRANQRFCSSSRSHCNGALDAVFLATPGHRRPDAEEHGRTQRFRGSGTVVGQRSTTRRFFSHRQNRNLVDDEG